MIRLVLLVGLSWLSAIADARQWQIGDVVLDAELFGFDQERVLLQRPDGELGMLDIGALSAGDREYLGTAAATGISDGNLNAIQSWQTKGGVELQGRIVDFARRDVTVQRRRGRIYVNDRAISNLPEFYRKLLPIVIEHVDGVEIPDDRALQNWVLSLRGRPRTFSLDGVIMEMENGDEYAIPFFVFADQDREWLNWGWADWIAAIDEQQRQEDQALRLRALAAAHFKNHEAKRQIAEMNLKLQAIRAGVTSAWEVTLYPAPGNPQPPRWVVMAGRNSEEATVAALQSNPGFISGPVRRVSRAGR